MASALRADAMRNTCSRGLLPLSLQVQVQTLATVSRAYYPNMPSHAPGASSPAVRAVMQGNRGRDTKPELLLRSAVFARGLRYRVDHEPIAGLRRRADMVFSGNKVAVFLHGCFWHGCPTHFHPPQTNGAYWQAKIDRNKERDRDTASKLILAGWTVVRVWEHDDVATAAALVEATVRGQPTDALGCGVLVAP